MAKQTVKTQEMAVATEAPKFKIPEEYKKVLYRDWPDSLKKEYQAYRKAGYARIEAEKNELWDKLISMLDGEALDLATQIRNGLKKKTGALVAIFGTDDVKVGDSVPFSMDLMPKVMAANNKGNVTLEIADNKITVAAVNA